MKVEEAAKLAYQGDYHGFLSAVGAQFGFEFGKSTLKGGVEREVLCKAPEHTTSPGKKAYANSEKCTVHCFSCGAGSKSWLGAIVAMTGAAYEDVLSAARQDARIAKVLEDNKSTVSIKVAPLKALLVACSKTPQNKGIEYLHSRGIDDETIKEDRWITAPDQAIKLAGYSTEELLKEDVLREGKKGPYCPWRGRVLMAVPGGLYGRDMRSDAIVPHMYSKGKKPQLLFGERIKASNDRGLLEKVLIVESALDASSSNQLTRLAGMKGRWVTAATLGTKGMSDKAIISELEPVKDKVEIVLVPDNDEWTKNGRPAHPGQTAGLEKAWALFKAGFRVRLARIRKVGADPNDLTAKLGYTAEMFVQMVNEAISPIEYALWVSRCEMGKLTDEGIRGYWATAVSIIREHYDGTISEDQICDFIARMGNWNIDSVKKSLAAELDKLSKRHLFNSTKSVIAELLQKGVSKEKIRADLGLE